MGLAEKVPVPFFVVPFFAFADLAGSPWYLVGMLGLLPIRVFRVADWLRCPACGAWKVGMWARFCSRCGARLRR